MASMYLYIPINYHRDEAGLERVRIWGAWVRVDLPPGLPTGGVSLWVWWKSPSSYPPPSWRDLPRVKNKGGGARGTGPSRRQT